MATTTTEIEADIHAHDDHHHGPEPGLMRWVKTTNHKDIGYLVPLVCILDAINRWCDGNGNSSRIIDAWSTVCRSTVL